MARREKEFFRNLTSKYDEGGLRWPPGWIVSFSDLMTLLLTFFIFFFSVTTLKKLPKVLKILSQEAGVITPIDRSEFPMPTKSTYIQKEYVRRESDLISNFKKYVEKAGLGNDVKLVAGTKEIKIVIANPILFDIGKGELKPQALPVLKNLAELFKDNDNLIRIEGHTDNVPISTEKFPSNWELSAARAINVIKYFIDTAKIPPARLEALGYGEFRPTALNETVAGRAQNRRVEIKIIQTESQ